MKSRIPIVAIVFLLLASVEAAASRAVPAGRPGWVPAAAPGGSHHPARGILDSTLRPLRITGEASFTARVNGAPWQATDYAGVLMPAGHVDFLALLGEHAPDSGDTTEIVINILVVPPLQPGTYALGIESFAAYSRWSGDDLAVWITDDNHTGSVTITSIDFPNQTIAGTFHFDAHDSFSGTTVAVTQGQFMIPLYAVQVVSRTWAGVKELYRRP